MIISTGSRNIRWHRYFRVGVIAGVLALAASCTAGSTIGGSTASAPPPADSVDSGGPAGSTATGPAATVSTGAPSGSGSSAATGGGSAPAGGGSSPGPSGSGPALSIGFILEPTSLDFTQSGGAQSPQVLLTNVYETLVKLDQKSNIVPGLASAYQISPDRKTYTFTLRSGVTFTNGAPFTAADAKFSLDRVKTDWKVAIKAQMDVVASTTAVSPTQLRVTLKQPSNSWLFAMTGRIGAMFSRTGVAALATTPVGTGPYVLKAWNRGDSIVLTRNPRYWGPAPALGQATFKYFKDGTAMDNALLTGGIQVVSTEQSPESLGQFKDPKYQIITGATDGEVMMTMNDGKPPLNDVRVRQAINYALDKKAILDGAWSGYGTVIGSHESPNDPWFVDEANRYPHDVGKAKELLAAAGQPNLTLSLKVPPPGYATAIAPIVISQLAEAGITVQATSVTWPIWLDRVFDKADYQLTIINHVEPRDIATLWANPQYYTRYDNPAVTKLLTDGDAGSQAGYVADYRKAVQLLADDAAAAWLFSFPNLVVADANVKGLPTNAVGESFVVADLSVG